MTETITESPITQPLAVNAYTPALPAPATTNYINPGSLYLLPSADRYIETRSGVFQDPRGVSPGTLSSSPSNDGAPENGRVTLLSQPFAHRGIKGGQSIPDGITAVQGTIQVLNPTGDGLLKIMSGNVADQNLGTSVMLFEQGENTSGHFLCPVLPNGDLKLVFMHMNLPAITADLIIDVAGFYFNDKYCKPAAIDLAYNKPVTSSGFWENGNPEKAVDRRWETIWVSNQSTGAWLIVDLGLGYTFPINKVNLQWAWDSRPQFGTSATSTIDVSTDGNNWTTVATSVVTPETNGKEQILRFPTVQARYVRFFGKEWNGGWAHVNTLEVYQAFECCSC